LTSGRRKNEGGRRGGNVRGETRGKHPIKEKKKLRGQSEKKKVQQPKKRKIINQGKSEDEPVGGTIIGKKGQRVGAREKV